MAKRQRSRRIKKPWGHELIWARTQRYVGKILHIKKGEALSLQYHRKKDETIHLLKGLMRLEVGRSQRRSLTLRPGDGFHITPQARHRMTALKDCDVLEVSTPELDDVVRLEDRYGRVKGG